MVFDSHKNDYFLVFTWKSCSLHLCVIWRSYFPSVSEPIQWFMSAFTEVPPGGPQITAIQYCCDKQTAKTRDRSSIALLSTTQSFKWFTYIVICFYEQLHTASQLFWGLQVGSVVRQLFYCYFFSPAHTASVMYILFFLLNQWLAVTCPVLSVICPFVFSNDPIDKTCNCIHAYTA